MQASSVHFYSKSIAYLAVAFLLAALFVHTALAAQVAISPSSGSYSRGQTFTATIQADPQGASVNAVEAQLTFDSSLLSVVSVSKAGSAFSLWTTEPTFSNTAGTIDFGGGSPSPFSSRSTLMTVTFRTLTEGSASVAVGTASVLAADGRGTDVFSGSVDANYSVAAAAVPDPTPTPTPTPESTPEPAEEEAAITFGDPPRAPEAGSATFLDQEIWYNTKAGVFTWTLPFDVDSMRLDIVDSVDVVPTTEYDPPIEDFATTDENLGEGEQYLALQFKNQVGWGGVLHRKIRIDTTPPEKFEIKAQTGNSKTAFPLLVFKAVDLTSGIDKYEMTIAGGEVIEITPDEAELGYLLGKLEDGTYTVRVTAFDQAGNEMEASLPVIITAGWMPEVESEDTNSFWTLFTGKNLLILLLLIGLIGQFIFGFYTRKQSERKEQKLRKETKEIQDQMEKIFSALRDEIYDQINTITKRERLSKKEKEAVENLNQALEVSETLIEKEIGDVKSILK